MKKLLAALMAGVVISGTVVTTASAHEHEVQPGENLWDIANEYETTVDELVAINDLKTTVIQPKQNIYINNTYVVEQGDTLSSISEDYDVTVDDLKEWNNLHTSLIVVGQELQIKGVHVDTEENAKVDSEKVAATEANSAKEGQKVKAAPQPTESSQQVQGQTISVTATAYTAGCEGCSGITATGVDLNANPNAKVIAVDPSVIPLGSEVYVEGYGYATAADVGGAIKGNKIDIHVPTKGEAYNWGVKNVNVTVIN